MTAADFVDAFGRDTAPTFRDRPPHILGIDPGARYVGVCLTCGPFVHAWQIIARARNADASPAERRPAVRDTMHDREIPPPFDSGALIEFGAATATAFAVAVARRIDRLALDWHADLIAVETMTPAGIYAGKRVNPRHVIDTAVVVGALATLSHSGHDTVLIEAGGDGHGRRPLGSYPDSIIAARESTAKDWRTRTEPTSSYLRHVRSAYDVARAAAIAIEERSP